MPLSLPSLLGWVALLCGVLSVFGLPVTWKLWGTPGMWGQALAAGLALAVLLVNAVFLKNLAQTGPGKAAAFFLFGSTVRVLICIAVAVVLGLVLPIPVTSLLVWVGLYYISSLAAEATWLKGAFRRDAARCDLGEIPRRQYRPEEGL